MTTEQTIRCDARVQSSSVWSRDRHCDLPATGQARERLNAEGSVVETRKVREAPFNFCTRHMPAAVRARAKTVDERRSAKFRSEMRKLRYGVQGQWAIKRLLEGIEQAVTELDGDDEIIAAGATKKLRELASIERREFERE